MRSDEPGLETEKDDFVWESNIDDAEPRDPIPLELALEEARPRGTRRPAPGTDDDTLGCLAGSETDAERILVLEMALRERTDLADGVGDPNRLMVGELIRDGDEVVERFRSIVDVIRRRVNKDGASSSSLECTSHQRLDRGELSRCTHLSLQPSPVVRPMPCFKRCPSRCLKRRLCVSRGSFCKPNFVDTEPAVHSSEGRQLRENE